MREDSWRGRAAAALLIMGGPAALGACAGMRGGTASMLSQGAMVPAVLLGVSVMMIPALYIGAAFLGIAPSARGVARAAAGSLRDTGTIALGLAPALLFMVATAQDLSTITVFSFLMISAAAMLGLRALYLRLFAGRGRALLAMPLFACWSLVSLGIGWRLMNTALEVTP